MINLIRLADQTTGHGKVIAASSVMRFDGRAVARKGDAVTCRKHPDVRSNVIIEGDESMTDNGVPIALHDHQVKCGCRLISSLV